MSGVTKAIVAVMKEVGAIGKNRTNPSQNYKFRGIDDVMAHVQDVMAKHGLICVPKVREREREMVDTKSGGRMASVRLLVDHEFRAEDDSFVTCTTLGEAMDSGDKASNKAMSAALKYALTETFMIPTYEADRDTESASPALAGAPHPKMEDLKAKMQASVNVVTARPANTPTPSGGVSMFPNYGRAKGERIAGASVKDLEFYKDKAIQSLSDPSKERWHAKEQALLDAINAELARQLNGSQPEEPPPPTDADAPF